MVNFNNNWPNTRTADLLINIEVLLPIYDNDKNDTNKLPEEEPVLHY